MILIRGGQVFSKDGFEEADVLVEGDSVTEVGTGYAGRGVTVIDASGCLVGPGFVDLHTHLRDPGLTWKEDVATGSAAAAAGGFTAVVAMPNTDPPIDQAKVVAEVRESGERVGMVDVSPAGALTKARAGLEVSDLEALYDAGVRIFTDDGDTVGDAGLVEEAMQRLFRLPGTVLAQHAEDTAMTAGGQMHEGTVSQRLGIGGLPYEAEEEIVARDLGLAAKTGARYHCQHVSSSGAVEMIREAKKDGVAVTAEVTPHHLSFDHTSLQGLDPNFKMYPPLRAETDRSALQLALRDGTVDVVATDHAPHTRAEKEARFQEAPRGVIGLETAGAAVNGMYRDPELLFHRLSVTPARIGGFDDQGQPVAPGAPANLVVFDPSARWVAAGFHSRSENSPYLGMTMTGRVTATIYRGRVSHLPGGGP